MRLSIHTEHWPTKGVFRIANKVFDGFDSVVVELSQDGVVGRGEALGVFYLGETVQSMTAQVETIATRLEVGISRAELQQLLPPGGARQAVDSALWDLECKSRDCSIWFLANVTPRALETVLTIGLEVEPDAMAHKARLADGYQLLKIKLDGDRPVERIRAIRAARPDARLVVDANQAWTFEQLLEVAPAMADLGVQMIEQPLPRGKDSLLAGYASPVRLCADESCLHLGELDQIAPYYQMVNVKIDKTGGLTHALNLIATARAKGLGVMVGTMGGSSLTMAPSFVAGCLADFVDVDGPLLQLRDRPHALVYQDGIVNPPSAELWG